MAFEFDTGVTGAPRKPYSLGNPIQHIVDNVRDGLPKTAAASEIDAATCLYLLGWMREPKTAPTLMRRLSMSAETLADIAERDPALVLGVLSEITERLDRFC